MTTTTSTQLANVNRLDQSFDVGNALMEEVDSDAAQSTLRMWQNEDNNNNDNNNNDDNDQAEELPLEAFPEEESFVSDQLSPEQRERILLDVHGVGIHNPSTFVPGGGSFSSSSSSSSLLEDALARIRDKPAYDLALRMDPYYVRDPALQGLFLHAEDGHVDRAAHRLVRHFQVKQQLFGYGGVLVRDVTWADLTMDDRRMASSGIFQLSPQRDAAGRTVVFFAPLALPTDVEQRIENMCRAFWYVLMSAILSSSRHLKNKKNKTADRYNGVVFCNLHIQPTRMPLAVIRAGFRVKESLPICTVAIHYAYQHASLHPQVQQFQRVVMLASQDAHIALRIRIHHHTNFQHLANHLQQTFGLPLHKHPTPILNNNNNHNKRHVSVAWHLDWLESIQDWERYSQRNSPWFQVSSHVSSSSSSSAHYRRHYYYPLYYDDCAPRNGSTTTALLPSSLSHGTAAAAVVTISPRRFDVLLGKTRATRLHTGTLRCQYLVALYAERYDRLSRHDKTQLTRQLVAMIHDAGGRFLRFDKSSQSWREVDDEWAREKLAHMFRNRRAEQQQQQQQQQQSAKTTTTAAPSARGRVASRGNNNQEEEEEQPRGSRNVAARVAPETRTTMVG